MYRKTILPVLLATIWISISEFIRNEFLLKSLWTDHYGKLGMVFPSEPVNGAIWGLWSLLLAIFIFILSKKFSSVQTTLLTWLSAFVMMWVVIGNMGVLPADLLLWAIPLSLLECWLAVWIINKLSA